ncbi:hypothetical protein [Clostridium sp. 001]|uniref:hypothetical protein n=1 Tax=Clostridium sp. 001 TaxID=1970093 RepID=UPI001C2C0D1D|nr:hypothetical protein [Clostridium sp. 001]QXE19546.1 hypothetical protein B5S50_12345 [Clostridium sp. 001]
MQEMENLVRAMKDDTNNSINSAVSGIGIEYGTITETGLQLDNFKHEITDYKVLDYLKTDKDYFTQTNSAGIDSHSHKVVTPEVLKPLKSGDRVLATQIGAEFIVIGRVS